MGYGHRSQCRRYASLDCARPQAVSAGHRGSYARPLRGHSALARPGCGSGQLGYALPPHTALLRGRRKEILQRAPHQHPADRLQLCIADALMAAARNRRCDVVGQRRRQYGGLHAHLLRYDRSARVLQHARCRCRYVLRQECLLGLQLGEQHGLSALQSDVPIAEGCARLA